MTRTLAIWEMGAGLGHAARLGGLCNALVERGHRVTAALRDTDASATFFTKSVERVGATPAPAPNPSPPRAATFADILCAFGWDDTTTLLERVHAWRELIRAHRPDRLVLDYAPAALLAARGLSIPVALLDTGFTCPPDVAPLPDLRPPGQRAPDASSLAHEETALATANAVLGQLGEPPLERLAHLWNRRTDARVLATFPELDHYEHRDTRDDFVGPWWHSIPHQPSWPDAEGPRLFAYLKPFPALPALLEMLRASGLPCLVYASGNAGAIARAAATDSLVALDTPVDTTRVVAEADLAILHSGAALSAAFLAAGVPTMHIPISLEQYPTAKRVSDLGAGRIADAKLPGTLAPALTGLLTDPAHTEAATSFASIKKDWTPEASLREAADRIAGL